MILSRRSVFSNVQTLAVNRIAVRAWKHPYKHVHRTQSFTTKYTKQNHVHNWDTTVFQNCSRRSHKNKTKTRKKIEVRLYRSSVLWFNTVFIPKSECYNLYVIHCSSPVVYLAYQPPCPKYSAVARLYIENTSIWALWFTNEKMVHVQMRKRKLINLIFISILYS